MKRNPKEFIFGFVSCLVIVMVLQILPWNPTNIAFAQTQKPLTRTIEVTETWFPIQLNGPSNPNPLKSEDTFIYQDRLYVPLKKLADGMNNLSVKFYTGYPENVTIDEESGLGIFYWQPDRLNLTKILKKYQNPNLPYVVSADFQKISGKNPVRNLNKDSNDQYTVWFATEEFELTINGPVQNPDTVLIAKKLIERFKLPLLEMIYENEKYLSENKN
ncbi:hypothetical protein HNQ80_001105 [Anaerosolibacter carboniphilus]|uniref:Uncharacterized protein n=1 Tax=Anaerosolibacter carboniphilus TaxID=1417629 RepID=A0A841KNL7_9FIRM|nr:hypothetical protein [Anaerosolibacter carboniphilus]MBB6215016.1 hypothetical protein [Anaerosolibacter carboniphilus]